MQVAELLGLNGAGRVGHQVRALRGFRERDDVADARPDRDNRKLASHNVAGYRPNEESVLKGRRKIHSPPSSLRDVLRLTNPNQPLRSWLISVAVSRHLRRLTSLVTQTITLSERASVASRAVSLPTQCAGRGVVSARMPDATITNPTHAPSASNRARMARAVSK